MGGTTELAGRRERQAHGGHAERVWKGQGERVEKHGKCVEGCGGNGGTKGPWHVASIQVG